MCFVNSILFRLRFFSVEVGLFLCNHEYSPDKKIEKNTDVIFYIKHVSIATGLGSNKENKLSLL